MRAYILVGISAVVAVAALAALSVVLLYRGGHGATSSATTDVEAAVKKALADITVKPRGIELTSEKALRVRDAIKRGDYATASTIARDVLTQSRMRSWDFQPFSRFMPGTLDVNDPAFATHLTDWVAASPQDAMPLVIRARYYRDLAWLKRGWKFVNQTQAADLDDFDRYQQLALDDINAAIARDASNPYSYYLRLDILHGFGVSRALAPAFSEAIARYPAYYPLYDIVLQTLEPKWGGSIAGMYDFVDRFAGKAQDDSPLNLLYLSLYLHLLNDASIKCYQGAHADQCVAAAMEKSVRPDLQGRINTALGLYDHTDKYQFGIAVENILADMRSSPGTDFYSGATLQLAVESMHSDAQLTEDNPGHNDYMADKLVAHSWYDKGYYDNAVQKEKEAAKDADAATFPSEEERDLAIAGIYLDLAGSYDQLHLYPEMIAAEQTSLALGGRNLEEHLICYGYYKLKAYADAVRTCDTAIADDPANITAYYWRGRTYDDMGRKDEALKALAVVAGSENGFREYAAIEMSMIYFGRKELHGALDLLNSYTYLYDPKLSSESSVAVAFNNRCYAYMELGELKKALADCRDSLKHGSIPDAYRKEQELVKRLGQDGSNL